MNSRLSFKILVVMLSTLAVTSLAHAQATRTWVSGVGDDVNPCSRTAPCKTFAGAISKTAAGGEISVLDPGGFGAVTITKAITLNGEGTLASILACGTQAIIVNAPATAVVKIIDLKILGCSQTTTPGTNGINFIAGKQLIVEDTKIYDFGTTCITMSNSGGSQLTVTNSTLTNCGSTAGINVSSTSSLNKAEIDRTVISKGTVGVLVANASQATVRNSDITFQSAAGVQAGPQSGGGSVANVANSSISFNGTGVQGNGASTFANIGSNTISFNTLGANANGGTLTSFGDNIFANNTADGIIPAPLPRK